MERATIYETMWKPTLVIRLPRDFCLFLLFAACLCWPITGNVFVAAGVFGLGWVVGQHISKNDPEFFSVWIVKLRRIGKTKNARNGNVYLP